MSEFAREIAANPITKCIGLRCGAVWIDYIILFALLFFLDSVDMLQKHNLDLIIWATFVLIYFPFMEYVYGATIGKIIFEVKVVNEKGNNPTFLQVTIRQLSRVIEVNPFLFGGLPAGVIAISSKYGQRYGDKLAKTFVLEKVHLKFGSDINRITREGKEFKHPLVHFDENYCTYYVWVSRMYVKYMKHFWSADDALEFVKLHPSRCLEAENEIRPTL